MSQLPLRPLDYAQTHPPDPTRPRHPAAIAWLLLLCVIAFFIVGALGLLCLDTLGAAAGGVMIASALFASVAILGLLSRPRPRFLAAAILIFAALAGASFALLLTDWMLRQLQAKVMTSPGVRLGGVRMIVVPAESDTAKSLEVMSMARTLNAVATGLAFCLLVYLIVQASQQRKSQLPTPPASGL